MGSEYGALRTQESIESRLASLASAQHGVFSREQALRSGAARSLIHRRIALGRWERMHPGVFRVAGSPPSWRQSLLAACLAKGDGAVVSHRSAAALWRLPGFEAGLIEITVPRTRRRNRTPGVTVHRIGPLLPADISTIEAFTVTAVARTLLDIASVASVDAVEEALDDALRRRLVSLARLRWRVSEIAGSGRRGSAAMRALLAARDPSVAVPESVFETRLLRLLRRTRIPEPVPQYPITDAGRVVAVVDFAFPSARVAVEAEGYRWHSGRIRWERDLARRNALTALGWQVVHVTWMELVAEGERVVERISKILEGDSFR